MSHRHVADERVGQAPHHLGEAAIDAGLVHLGAVEYEQGAVGGLTLHPVAGKTNDRALGGIHRMHHEPHHVMHGAAPAVLREAAIEEATAEITGGPDLGRDQGHCHRQRVIPEHPQPIRRIRERIAELVTEEHLVGG